MSPRAAWRLESLGFTAVYDYAPGEADWFAAGLPMAGARAALPRVGQVVRRDVPCCGLSETMGAVRGRVQTAGWDICVVVNEVDVVLGLLRETNMTSDPEQTVEQVMRSGPATYRPDALIAEVAERIESRGVPGVLVTLSDGRLIGWLRRDDAARAAAQTKAEAGENGRAWVRT